MAALFRSWRRWAAEMTSECVSSLTLNISSSLGRGISKCEGVATMQPASARSPRDT
jgi:hypothetical protein